ncbi:hypothetical protein GCM10007989_02140 [Devosia pacifica]|uniref:Uncharacterized protein n=1 Tax=Devosia pacifica TaxID=1335967 RepID=A0A918VNI4_9HYPH|nr:hypothetical protein GCM10007989_02140 [Devosia pacifica]
MNDNMRPLIYYRGQLNSDQAMTIVPVHLVRAPGFPGLEGAADMLVTVAAANRLARVSVGRAA